MSWREVFDLKKKWKTGIIKRDTVETYVTGTLKNGGGIVRSRVEQGGGGGISMETQFAGVCEDNNTANFLGPSCFYQPQSGRPISLSEPSFSIDYT